MFFLFLDVQLQNYRQREKVTASIYSKTNYPFDYFFERTQPSQVEGEGDSSPEDSDSEHTNLDSKQVPSSSEEQVPVCTSQT